VQLRSGSGPKALPVFCGLRSVLEMENGEGMPAGTARKAAPGSAQNESPARIQWERRPGRVSARNACGGCWSTLERRVLRTGAENPADQIITKSHPPWSVRELVRIEKKPPDIGIALRLRDFGNDGVHVPQAQTLVVTLGGERAGEDRPLLTSHVNSTIGAGVIDHVHPLASLGDRVPYRGGDNVGLHPCANDAEHPKVTQHSRMRWIWHCRNPFAHDSRG
jgi:hypothetical protein